MKIVSNNGYEHYSYRHVPIGQDRNFRSYCLFLFDPTLNLVEDKVNTDFFSLALGGTCRKTQNQACQLIKYVHSKTIILVIATLKLFKLATWLPKSLIINRRDTFELCRGSNAGSMCFT